MTECVAGKPVLVMTWTGQVMVMIMMVMVMVRKVLMVMVINDNGNRKTGINGNAVYPILQTGSFL